MSQNTSFTGRAIEALSKPVKINTRFMIITLCVLSIVSGTVYRTLWIGAQSEGGSTGGTCGQQPNWPDCATFSCTSGNWTCTSMKPTTSYPSGGTQGGSTGGGMNIEQCLSGCSSMTGTEEQKTMCRNGCNTMGTGTYPSGPYNGGMSVEQCKASCGSDECRRGCDSMSQTSGYTGSTRACGPNEFPTAQNPCMFNPMGSTNPTSGGTHPCAPGEQPVNGSCYVQGGTNPGTTGRMCDFYRNGPPPSCVYSSPACAVYTEPPEALSCDDSRCTSSWNRNCFTQGSRPNSEGSGSQSGGHYQGGGTQGGYGNMNAGEMHNASGYFNGGFYPGMMNQGSQGGTSEEMRAQQEAMMKEQQVRMLEQMKNEGARQCQHFLDPLQSAFNMPKAMQDAIKGYHKKCVAGVQTAVSPEEFYGLMESLRKEMMGLFEKTAGCDGVESFIRGMEQGATNEAPRFIEQTKKRNPTLAAQMEEMRQQTISAVNTAKKQVAGGECEAARMTMEAMEQTFESASRSWGNGFEMLDGDEMADHFTEKMQKHGVHISAGDLQKYGIAGTDHMDVMSGLMTYGGDKMATLFQDEGGANIIKTLTAGGATSEQTSLMAQILEENKRLREEVGELRSQLNKTQAALADRLSSLTADTKIASQIQDFVAHELADTELTPKEADTIYEAFMIENGRELMKKGLVTNIDLNLGDWYTPVVITANKEGFMKGDPTGYFRPAADMNQAEAAVTMARAFGVEVTEGAASSDPRFVNYPDWSRASIKALEENGIDLSVLSAKPDQAISRSQVSVLLSSLLPDEATEGKSAKVFTDIGGVDLKTADAIRELSALGIANGVNNGTKYNPNGTVNRATFATYLTRSVDAAEEFLGVNAASEKESTEESAQ